MSSSTVRADFQHLSGLVAATFTPMKADGSLNLSAVPRVTDAVIEQGADGLFLCGSTGEGASLASGERREVAEAYFAATRGRVPVITHVGHNSLAEARALAAHSAALGIDAIAVAPPSYFRPADLGTLIDCIEEIATGAPTTPLFYYHIPRITGVDFRVIDLLEAAGDRLPSLVGVKFSSFEQDDLLCCLRHEEGRYNILFGADEMLLAGLASGAPGAVGSTYNFMAPYYKRVIEAFRAGNMAKAQQHQFVATRLVHAILRHGGHNAIKASMGILSVDCGPPRLPVKALGPDGLAALRRSLDECAALEVR